MSSKFFTNNNENTLIRKFEGVFTYNPNIRYFDAIVGYLRASGYFKVAAFLRQRPEIKVRILIGINVDKLLADAQKNGLAFFKNQENTKKEFIQKITEDIEKANYLQETEEGILQFLEDIIEGKVQMRAHPDKNIHAKVYIFRPEPFNEHTPASVITGSSNLTDSGLGLNHQYEFNVQLSDYADIKFANDEFENLWAEAIPILQAEAASIRQKSYLRDDFTPYELYIKMLMEYFGKRVEYDPYNIDVLLPAKYKRLKYQSDAANQGYAIMMKHNGFILADVVGLGKTIIACMVIKKFIYENGTHSKVLAVVPPALEANWHRTTEEFQIKNHFEILTLGSLHKVTNEDNYSNSNADKFDLIVVDESHKFRNSNTNMYLDLQDICKKPRSKPSENGDARKKVILISATPLNNHPQDIENQLYLFQDKRNSTLDNVKNLQEYFKTINDKYKKLSNEKTLNIKELKLIFQKLRDDVIEPLVIRRTRTDIEKDSQYLEDIKSIIFPKLNDPIALFYELDDRVATLFFDTVSLLTSENESGEAIGLGYYRYRAIEFLKYEADKKIYGNVTSISERLSAIMKTLLVKRLESSFFAFIQSISRFQKAINNMIEMFENNRVFIAPDINVNQLLDAEYSYDEIEEKINQKGHNNRVFASSSFDSHFLTLLKADKYKIDELVARWSEVKKDPKLDTFLEKIQTEFFKDKTHNHSGQLVIFSESKETAEMLSKEIRAAFEYRVLTVNAGNRASVENILRENFDANLDEQKWKNDYDIIVTTEVLAEGINLHRSNLIVNYDVPWNATRLMQRIGRVNRIGSRAKEIFVYNFYPSAHGDEQIKLVNNALRKLQSFHTAFGEDNKIFSLLEEKSDNGFNNKIPKEESETLKYLNELREFKKKYPKRFAEIAKIPNKARCGRDASDKQLTTIETNLSEVNYPLKNTSLAYLKSENHPGIFCLITANNSIIELNFLQAVKIYKANENEKAVALHALHFEQTNRGFEYFKSEKNQENIQRNLSSNLSPTENKAITNIQETMKYAPTPQKRMALNRVREIIKDGTYGSKGFPKSINDFYEKNKENFGKEPQKFIESLFTQLLDRYDLSAKIDTAKESGATQGITNPKIVLTQSFV